MKELSNSLNNLLHYIEKEEFKGYDPYDLLNTPFPFRIFGKMAQAIVVQAGKLLPYNIRPLLAVKKEITPKGIGLLLSAYSKLYSIFGEYKFLNKANILYETLKQCRSQGYEEYCWGCNFDWANPHGVIPKYMPSSVVTSFVCQGMFEYYNITKKEEVIDIIESSAKYILKYLKTTTTNEGICLSYSEEEQNCCYNASLLSGELLSIKYTFSKDPKLYEKIVNIISFVLSHQHTDGHWEYSINISTGKERNQIDFHQGFILCSLYRICNNIGHFLPEVKEAIKKGLKYYRTIQFTDNGQSVWRVPKTFPIDIHNQAQGIITFSMLNEYDDSYSDFAKTITEWTIDNMQSSNGYFYYRIFKQYTIRTPFMRWSQAWMLLAYSYLLKNMTCNNVPIIEK